MASTLLKCFSYNCFLINWLNHNKLVKIIKYINIPFDKDGFTWSICPYSGSLIKAQTVETTKILLPEKVNNAIRLCNNPYLCQPYDTVFHNKSATNKNTFDRLNLMHKRFLGLGNKRFFLSLIYANLQRALFHNTTEALMAISDIALQKEQFGKLCLQRTLLALKTSNSFQENGVLFIGALLPTVTMHAWIIENNTQPDFYDREWILYRPLLAFYYD